MNNDKVYDKAEEMAEKVLCTGDKCVCPKIKEAGLCSGCDVFMALRDYYAEEEIKSFALSDWQEIKEILDSGKAKEVFEVGDEREETLITGEKITLVLLGFGQDEKVSGGKANMTIGLKDLMDGDFEMNLEHKNAGGWDKSRMRTVYMERIFKLLPEDLRELIVPVKKCTSAGNGSTDITVSEDKLFLFSLAEIYSTRAIKKSDNGDISQNADVYQEEGEQYEYFKNLLGDADPYDDNEETIKCKANGCGSATTGGFVLRASVVPAASAMSTAMAASAAPLRATRTAFASAFACNLDSEYRPPCMAGGILTYRCLVNIFVYFCKNFRKIHDFSLTITER